MSGFYLMHRGWQDNPIFKPEPFTEREAWEWIIANAAWKACRVRIKSIMVDVERGQLAASLRYMAEKWQWLEPRVRRFLGRLEKEGMIGCVADAGVNVVTVCNYDEYQAPSNIIDAQTDAASTQDRRSIDANKKEDNKYNKGERRDLTVDPTDQPSESGLAVGLPANDNPPEKPAKQKRGTRVPDGDLPEEWAVEANHTREKAGMPLLGRRALAVRWEAFQDYWRGVTGSKGLKADWLATWRNDCRDPRTEKRFPATAPPANGNALPPPAKRRTVKDLQNLPDIFDGPTDI